MLIRNTFELLPVAQIFSVGKHTNSKINLAVPVYSYFEEFSVFSKESVSKSI